MPGDEISQSSLGDENDDSERGKIWDGRSYLSLFGVAGIDDSSEEGAKNRDNRECVSTRANDLYNVGCVLRPRGCAARLEGPSEPSSA
jgi:hypothetical protein